MQKENPTADFPGNSLDSSNTTFDDFVCSNCFYCLNNNSEKENMSNKMEKLVDKMDLLQQQIIQQNLLFQKLQQHLIDGREKNNESLLKVEDKIVKLYSKQNLLQQNEKLNEKFCALQRSVQECKMENAEKVEKIDKNFEPLVCPLPSSTTANSTFLAVPHFARILIVLILVVVFFLTLFLVHHHVNKYEEWNEKFCALQRNVQEFKIENGEKVEKTIGKNVDEKIADLEKKFGVLLNNLSIRSFKMNFVKVENNWDKTNGYCCDDKCILLNLDGNCKNGIVKLCGGGKVDYLKGNGYNQYIRVFAKTPFKKSFDFTTFSSFNVGKTLLFYFEVTVIRNEDYFSVGLKTNKWKYYVNSHGYYWKGSNFVEKFFPRELKDGDVVGCGLILPSTIFSENNRPIMFFTLNGEKIDDYRVLENEDINTDFVPFVGLNKCSVEANFGEKEFRYKIEEVAI